MIELLDGGEEAGGSVRSGVGPEQGEDRRRHKKRARPFHMCIVRAAPE